MLGRFFPPQKTFCSAIWFSFPRESSFSQRISGSVGQISATYQKTLIPAKFTKHHCCKDTAINYLFFFFLTLLFLVILILLFVGHALLPLAWVYSLASLANVESGLDPLLVLKSFPLIKSHLLGFLFSRWCWCLTTLTGIQQCKWGSHMLSHRINCCTRKPSEQYKFKGVHKLYFHPSIFPPPPFVVWLFVTSSTYIHYLPPWPSVSKMADSAFLKLIEVSSISMTFLYTGL